MGSPGEALAAGLIAFGIDLMLGIGAAVDRSRRSLELTRHVIATGLCLSCSCRTFQPAWLPQEALKPVKPLVPAPKRKRALGGRPKRPVGTPK